MIVLNVIAWIFLIMSILAFTKEVVIKKTTANRALDFVLLLGYICTLIAYINK